MKDKKITWSVIILVIIIVIAICAWHYFWFMKNFKISANSNANDVINVLIGFYSSLFTAIAVIIGILAIIGWQWGKDLNEKLKRFEIVENKVNFLNKKEELSEWAKAKVDKLGLSTFELKKMDKEDKEKLKEIYDYVINDLTNCGWLELFLAHQFMTEDKNYDKAESILKFIERRDLLEENSKIHSFIYHFLGQLNWEKYCTTKESINYFESKDEKLLVPKPEERKLAIESLKESCKNYDKSIEYIKKRKEQKTHEYDDRSYANKAIVLIEQYKFYRCEKKNNESNDRLEDVRTILEDIRKKDYNIYYDLARVYFYLNKQEKTEECLRDFKENIELCEKKEKYELKKRHIEYMKKEREELNGEGFPGKKFNIQEFFGDNPSLPNRIRNAFKRKK